MAFSIGIQSILLQSVKANWTKWESRRDFLDLVGKELYFESLESMHGLQLETIRNMVACVYWKSNSMAHWQLFWRMFIQSISGQ